MADTGWLDPTDHANVDNGGNPDWSDTGNILSSNNSYATVGLNANESDNLVAKTFSPSIAVGSTIRGFEVRYERKADGTGEIVEASVSLSKDGTTPAGNGIAPGGNVFETTDTVRTLGSSTELAGISWTRAEALAVAVMIVAGETGVGSDTAYIDHVQIKIYYSPPADHLVFSVQPTNTTQNQSISPAVQVQGLNSENDLDPLFTAAVTIAIGTNPASGTLSGDTNNNASAGTASFSDLNIDNPGTGYTLTADSAGLTGATSSTFNITAAVANTLKGLLLLGVGR